ncbi:MAG: DUF1320 domain-containing protein [bacterium]|nr:DUF1320 domain-containing protein [bacterium]
MYSTPDELKLLLSEKELVQLASDGRVGLWLDPAVQAVLNEAIDQADSEIDGYLSLVVELPLNLPPRLVGNLSAKIAVYNLLRRRPTVPDHWQSEYQRCRDLLLRIAEGKLKLPVEEDGGSGLVDDALDPGRIVVVTRDKEW